MPRRSGSNPTAGASPARATTLEPLDLVDLDGHPVPVPDPNDLVHLQLRRFAGCPVCNLHLRSFDRRHAEIEAAGVREVVVFHSTADDLRPFTAALPFAVVPDPDKVLYRRFGVGSSPRSIFSPRAWPTIVRAIGASLWAFVRHRAPMPPLNPPGGRYGLPADLLVAPDGTVLAIHRGEHADDQWTVDELLDLVGRERL